MGILLKGAMEFQAEAQPSQRSAQTCCKAQPTWGVTRYLHVRRILRGLQVLQSSPWVFYSWSGWRRILLVKSCRLAVGRCMSRADGCGRTLVVRMCQVGRTRGNVLSLNLVGKHLSHLFWRMLSLPGQRSARTCGKIQPTWGVTRYLHVRRILRGLHVLQSSPWVLYSW